jgi:energy-coupling factor transport system ATP-binding protein
VDETVAALIDTPGLVDGLRSRSLALPGGSASVSAAVSAPELILRTERLDYHYADGHQALSQVTMSLGRGGFTAIAGANGAGKTTLASLLAGAREAPRGKIFLELAFSLAPRSGRRRAGKLSVEQRSLVDSWLERLGLLPLAEANPFSLSQGQKRRLSVGAMLIRGQSALVLDEPTLGQDELQSQRLMTMMHSLRAEGRTVAMITHDMRLVAENADSLVVLNGGRVLFSGAPGEFFHMPAEVERAGLAMPALGRVSYLLHGQADTPNGLYTLELFCQALGAAREDTGGGAEMGREQTGAGNA